MIDSIKWYKHAYLYYMVLDNLQENYTKIYLDLANCSETSPDSGLSTSCIIVFGASHEWLDGEFHSSLPGQNGHHFADDIFKRSFFFQKVRISIEMSLKFVLEGPINNIRTLVQIMACRRPSHYLNQCRPSSPTHICGTSGGWVNLCRWETQPSSSDANVLYVFNHCCVCSSFSGGLHVSGQIWS